MSTEAIMSLFKTMVHSSVFTLKIFFFTLILGLPLGLIVAVGRMSKHAWVRGPVKLFLLIVRGTPLILQLMVVFYGPYFLFKITMNRFDAAIIAFTINYAAYFAEIYRSGIESIPKGQTEASQVIGFTKAQTFFKIVLPQVVKRILPPMGSEFMTLVKDSALAQIIGVTEIYHLASSMVSAKSSIIPLIMAGGFYLVMNTVVGRCFALAEKKFEYYK